MLKEANRDTNRGALEGSLDADDDVSRVRATLLDSQALGSATTVAATMIDDGGAASLLHHQQHVAARHASGPSVRSGSPAHHTELDSSSILGVLDASLSEPLQYDDSRGTAASSLPSHMADGAGDLAAVPAARSTPPSPLSLLSYHSANNSPQARECDTPPPGEELCGSVVVRLSSHSHLDQQLESTQAPPANEQQHEVDGGGSLSNVSEHSHGSISSASGSSTTCGSSISSTSSLAATAVAARATAQTLLFLEVPSATPGIDSDGNVIRFDGEWVHGKCSGKGSAYYPSGRLRYTGSWRKGKYHGQGCSYFESGSKRFEGSWRAGFAHGHGIRYWENSDIPKHIGMFVNGYCDGDGERFYSDGTLQCRGTWRRARRHGHCTVYYPNNGGVQFVGEMLNGKACGFGIMYYAHTGFKRAEGEFRDDMLNGYGTTYHRNGTKSYEGHWLNGMHHGVGDRFRDDGVRKLHGSWHKGKVHGHATRYGRDGVTVVFDGEFVRGAASGRGSKYYYPSGKLAFQGEFKNGLYHGQGVRYRENGTKQWEGMWANGKQHGRMQYHARTGHVFSGIFEHGVCVEQLLNNADTQPDATAIDASRVSDAQTVPTDASTTAATTTANNTAATNANSSNSSSSSHTNIFLLWLQQLETKATSIVIEPIQDEPENID